MMVNLIMYHAGMINQNDKWPRYYARTPKDINKPVRHGIGKQEKCSSLEQPRGIRHNELDRVSI